jgi:hypothetical protein
MKTNILIIVVAAIVAAGVGYVAYGAGQTAGIAQASAIRTGFFGDQQRFPGGQPAPSGQNGGQRSQGGNGAAPGGAGAAFFGGLQGTVDKVDGNTLTVSITRGGQTQSVKVTVASDTTVQEFTTGSLADVKTGSRVLIGMDRAQGGAAAPGGSANATPAAGNGGTAQQFPTDITARTITLLPANFGQ